MAELDPAPRSDQPRSLPLRAALGGLKRGFEALGVRNYRLYWSGQVVSLIGTWMQQVSLPWLVLSLGGEPIQLGLIAVLQFGPAMLLAPFGGVFADRIEKRHALIATQIAAAGQAFTIFLICVTGIVEIWMVLAMAGVLGLINAVDMPVRQSLASDLVPRHLLANAIALNSMAFNSARVVGPALAGVIIAIGTGITGSAVAGVAINLGINTLTYSGVLIGLLRMDPKQIRRHEQPERHPPVLESLREGVSLRGPHAARAVVPRPAGRHRGLRLQLPDPAAALLARGARPDRGGLRRALRGDGHRLAGGLADAGVHAQSPRHPAHARRRARVRRHARGNRRVPQRLGRREPRARRRLLQHADDQHDQCRRCRRTSPTRCAGG